MPDVVLPGWVNALLVAGLVAGAIMGVVTLSVRTTRGISWLGRHTQETILAPAREDIDRLETKIDQIMRQLTSANGGSIREQVNGIREDLSSHIVESTKDRRDLWAKVDDLDSRWPDEAA